ncbi:hypothetical protein EB72_24735 [Mycobacterium sp. SWH-M1]|nr:hypothetical protein EB72_24735 [Mycobacterium sp. SWH-M1]
MTEISVDTQIAVLKITLADRVKGGHTVASLTEYMAEVKALLAISAYLEVQRHPGMKQPKVSGVKGGMQSPEHRNWIRARVIADRFGVRRFTYHSPVDIWLIAGAVSAGSGAVTAASFATYKVGQRALKLWDQWCDTRRKHSHVALNVEYENLLREQIAVARAARRPPARRRMPVRGNISAAFGRGKEAAADAVMDDQVTEAITKVIRLMGRAERIAIEDDDSDRVT